MAGAAQDPGTGGLVLETFGTEQGLPGLYVPDLELADDGRLLALASGRLVAFDGLVFDDVAVDSGGRAPALTGIGRGQGDTVWITTPERLLSLSAGRTAVHLEPDVLLRDVWRSADGILHVLDDGGILRRGESGFDRIVDLTPGWNRGRIAATPRDTWVVDDGGGSVRSYSPGWVDAPQPVPDAWPRVAAGHDLRVRPTPDGIEVRERTGALVSTLPSSPDRVVLLLAESGLVWVTGPARTLEAFDRSGERVATFALPEGASVRSAREDREGNVWFGTLTAGLIRVRSQPVRTLGAGDGLTDGQIRRLSRGGPEAVLATDPEGRVVRIGPEGAETVFEPEGSSEGAVAALTDRRGTLWLSIGEGDAPRLVGRASDGGEIELSLPSPARRIVEDPREDGTLWLLMDLLLMRVRVDGAGPPAVESVPLPRPLGGGRDLLVARDGSVWAAGERGVVRLRDGELSTYFQADGFPTGGARALYEDPGGAIWIGRYFGGLVRHRDGRFQSVGADDGLWDDVVSSILPDGRGNLWMGSNRGVHRVSLEEVEAVLAGERPRVRGRGYGAGEGFSNPEASGWHAYRTDDGRLWFPTFGGIAVIDPTEVLDREAAPVAIRIRGVRAGGRALPVRPAVTLPRGVRSLEVEYGAVALSGHRGIGYQVRMDGVDAEWQSVGPQRQVTYAGLPPGSRTVRVRAVSGDGTLGPEQVLAVAVPPFFHETPLFVLLMGTLLVAGAWGAHHLRTRQLRVREAGLQRMVDERTVDLVRARARTEEALEARTRFFANVSHELRTPLTLVQGPLQDVLDGRLGPTPDQVREQLETVQASGRRLGELVEQLLDAARLDAGEFHLKPRNEDLGPLLRRLAESFAVLARSRGVDFDVRIQEGEVRATVDVDRIEKVCANLLVNAFGYTPSGGCVGFRAAVTEADGQQELVLVVEDDGPGIPEHERERVFERFYRIDQPEGPARRGTGIGLALVQEITGLHGGRVELDSELGRGSRFTVRIPVPRAGAPIPAAGPAVPPPPPAPLPAPDGATTSPTDPDDDSGRPTVLVVEDHDALRAYLRRHLEDRYRVLEARDGREGLETARRIVPDLILCDLMMPNMSGEELCRVVRADPELSFLPLIVVSARGSRGSRIGALDVGADDYLVKPFDPEELRLRVDNALASRRRLRERLQANGEAMPTLEPAGDSRRESAFGEALVAVLRDRLGDEDLDADAIARAMAMSRATLYRRARDELEATPLEYLWRLRLQHAARLLEETSATVSEVAYACGFKTVPHFTRRFKERFEITPAAYRDGARGEP